MLEDIVKKLNKITGKDIAFTGAERTKVEALPTGIEPLDLATGIGGLPKGRVVEIHGLPSSAKTSLCLAIVANLQKRGVNCAYIDAEYAFNSKHAQSYGVDMDKLITIQVDCGEEAFEAMDRLIQEDVGLIVVDSVSALSPQPEVETEYGKPTMGGQARLISQGLRKIIGALQKSGAVIVFINQLRMNIMGTYGSPYTQTGGEALKYYTSISLDLHRKAAIMQGDKTVGYEIQIKFKKNKVGPPATECTLQLIFGKGFSGESDLLLRAEEAGLVTKEGNTYLFHGEKLAVGRQKTVDFLNENPQLYAKIKAKLSA